MRHESAAIELAVERVYAMFARYPRHLSAAASSVEESEQCQQMKKRLQARTLRDQPVEDLDFTWLGDEASLKHFLPRLLELVAQGAPVDGLILALHLERVGLTAVEREAVFDFYTALFSEQLHASDERGVCESLMGLAVWAATVAPLLDVWEVDRTRGATLLLACFVVHEWSHWSDQLLKLELGTSRQAVVDEMQDWLTRTAAQRLETTYLQDPAAEGSALIAAAVDQLALVPPAR